MTAAHEITKETKPSVVAVVIEEPATLATNSETNPATASDRLLPDQGRATVYIAWYAAVRGAELLRRERHVAAIHAAEMVLGRVKVRNSQTTVWCVTSRRYMGILGEHDR